MKDQDPSNNKKIIINSAYIQRLGEEESGKSCFDSFDNFFKNYFIEVSKKKQFKLISSKKSRAKPLVKNRVYAWRGTEGICFCPDKNSYVSNINLVKGAPKTIKSKKTTIEDEERNEMESKNKKIEEPNIYHLNYSYDGSRAKSVYFDKNTLENYIIYFEYDPSCGF